MEKRENTQQRKISVKQNINMEKKVKVQRDTDKQNKVNTTPETEIRNKEHVIIGTAGHIDHGKTALIHALTGRDTDRLKEEKQRGISIDLGFTWFDLPDGTRAGIIDVPGHEKFLPNMLAGVCGMDLVLLVIALDEGVMPQTREHLEILTQLDVKQGIVVLTKSDMVELEWADMMEEEIRENLKSTLVSEWPMIRVSAVKHTGIEELKNCIVHEISRLVRNRSLNGKFRLPIDRVMSLKGLGTVIAGTLLEGMIYPDEEITIYPTGQKSRIRSIQVHEEPVDKAYAGQRTALLLANVKKEEVSRGFVAAASDSLQLSHRLDVRIRVSKETERILKNQCRMHLHIGTSQMLCRVVLLENDELKKGETGIAQLLPEEPVAVRRGDRFVLRFFSPLETVAGGRVIDECAKKHKRKDPDVLAFLRSKEDCKDEDVCLTVLAKSDRPMDLGKLQKQIGLSAEMLEAVLMELNKEQRLAVIPGKRKEYYWTYDGEEETWQSMSDFLHTYHRDHPYRRGIVKALLKSSCFKLWEPDCLDAYLDYCAEGKRISASGGVYCLSEFASEFDDRLEADAGLREMLQKFSDAFTQAGFDFCKVRELKPEKMTEEDFGDVLEYFAGKKCMIRISDDFYTTPEIGKVIIQKVLEYFEKEEILSFGTLRDLLGTSRRSSKPLMAYLDEQKITAWCGKETERVRNKR